jgi:homoserine dehydrogenase
MSSIAFGIPLQFEKAYTEGISGISIADIRYAKDMGYVIKHLGITRKTDDGVELRVHPALIHEDYLLASVDGVMNAVMVHGDAVGSTLYYGAGAGALPTGAAVVSDVIDVVRNMRGLDGSVPALAFSPDDLSDLPVLPIEEITSAYYLRIPAMDRAGVLADITGILASLSINIEGVIQEDPRKNQPVVPVIILTHEVKEKVMNEAISKIEALDAVEERVTRIRVAELEDQ